MNNQKNNFLTPDLNQIRHTIKGIDDSYNHDWDILAELCQNSVDAIRETSENNGRIDLEINAKNRSVKITDNGIGIKPDRLPNLLKPFSTDKAKNSNSIGEKGVGLTFAMFSCNKFYIKSGNSNGVSEARVNNALSWKKSNDDSYLNLENHTILEEEFYGTEVYLEDVKESPIFELNFDQLKFVLRTKTSLGNTKSLWQDDQNIDIYLNFIDINGKRFNEKIDFKYRTILDEVSERSKIDLEEFVKYLKEKDRTNQEKRNKLRDKIIYKKGSYTHNNNREINYIACFVPNRNVWKKISVSKNLCTEEQLKNDSWLDKYEYTIYQNGIFTSVKGMPTGIKINNPSTGSAGYWSNIFILFEDQQLKFDVGRKSIHGSQASIHRKYAKILFNEFLDYVRKYVSGDINS